MPKLRAHLKGPLTRQDAWRLGHRLGMAEWPNISCIHILIERGAPYLSPAFLSGIKGYNKGLTAGREVRAAWMLLGNVVSLDDLREKGWEPGDDDIQDDTNNLYEAFERNPDD